MKLPTQKKILREDVKDAPDWISGIITPVNNFMETVYLALNKNIDENNLLSQIIEVQVKTTAAYPVMDPFEFQRTIKVKGTGLQVLQVVEKTTYIPASVQNPAWVDDNGTIRVYGLVGLEPSKTYIVRFRLT